MSILPASPCSLFFPDEQKKKEKKNNPTPFMMVANPSVSYPTLHFCSLARLARESKLTELCEPSAVLGRLADWISRHRASPHPPRNSVYVLIQVAARRSAAMFDCVALAVPAWPDPSGWPWGLNEIRLIT